MRLLPRLLVALSLGFVALGAQASPDKPVEGSDYRALEKAQPTDSGKKIEVTEFFWYACPHCNAFEPSLNEWVKKQGDRISYKRVPVNFRPSFLPQQKLYYTLEAMGKLEEIHPKVFQVIHGERKGLDNDNAVIEFAVKQGLDKAKFTELYNSFGVQTKTRRASQMQADYGIDGVPTIVIGGRYVTSPSIAGAALNNAPEVASQNAALQVMSFLVDKAAKEQGAGSAAAPAAPPASQKKGQAAAK